MTVPADQSLCVEISFLMIKDIMIRFVPKTDFFFSEHEEILNFKIRKQHKSRQS